MQNRQIVFWLRLLGWRITCALRANSRWRKQEGSRGRRSHRRKNQRSPLTRTICRARGIPWAATLRRLFVITR